MGPLRNKTLAGLRLKHPDPVKIHRVRFEEINQESIHKATVITKSGSGPSGLDDED